MIDVDIKPVGDAAVLAVVGDTIEIDVVERVWALGAACRRLVHRGVLDVVPAYGSVMVRFDPLLTDLPRIMAAVRGAAETASAARLGGARRLTIRVCFGGQFGLDFETCAHELGMREARFRDAFCRPDYRVAFLGFVAGFPYLMGLPPALRMSRLSSPRPRVPAGSVAMAAGQCGIYPRQTPGGWRILGRTAAPLFDPLRGSPALLAPADMVRFVPAETFEETAAVDFEEIAS
jgi:KipI family sensor histidine kinase inhibitor